MRIRISVILVCLSLLMLATVPSAAAARKRLPSKKTWYAQVNRIMAPAPAYLKQRVAQSPRNHKLAINLDIDNVSLATRLDRKRPVPATLALAQQAKALGVKVFFNTGRDATKLAAVIPLLEAAGFGATDYCGRMNGENLATSKQRCRASFVAKGYTLVLNVGNNPTDFVGGNYEKAIRLPNYRGRLS